jgi:hypothetical protein
VTYRRLLYNKHEISLSLIFLGETFVYFAIEISELFDAERRTELLWGIFGIPKIVIESLSRNLHLEFYAIQTKH